MARPNILYIHSHDTGRYIQPYGHAVPTGNLQRLAEQGVLFRQAFCVGPTCSPSRAGLLTGQSAHSSGMLGLAHRGFRLNDYKQHLVHTLHKAGYTSTLIGVQHVAKDPSIIGYHHVVQLPSSAVKNVAPTAVGFLNNGPTQPFFLSVGFIETHLPFHPPGPNEDPRYGPVPPPLPDTPAIREDFAAFKASARVLDEGVGAVLDALNAAGLADHTLVIATTDHGVAFPGMKCNLTDHGIGVMLILRGPGGFAGGKVCEAMVSHVDIFPTLCEYLGIDPPPWLEGTSMMPLIRGEGDRINEQIFAEVTYHAAYEPQRAVRTERWKYIRRFGDRATPVMPNCDDSDGKAYWVQCGWRDKPVAAEQLYDLVFDPNETNNLIDDPAGAAVLADMRGRLDRWMKKTNDPLLAGPVPPPAGARINDPDGLSPSETSRKTPQPGERRR